MWSWRDGKYVVEYRRKAVKQTFVHHREEYMDMVSGKIGREEVRFLDEESMFRKG